MFIDTSAFVAILAPEAEQRRLLKAIEDSKAAVTSGLVRLETTIVLTRLRNDKPRISGRMLDEFLEAAGIEIIPITDEMSRIAVEAFARYGKGQAHKAQLNLADCMSYAAAKLRKQPILCKGDDFAVTDLRLARY